MTVYEGIERPMTMTLFAVTARRSSCTWREAASIRSTRCRAWPNPNPTPTFVCLLNLIYSLLLATISAVLCVLPDRGSLCRAGP